MNSAGSRRRARRAQNAPSLIVRLWRHSPDQQRGDEEARQHEEGVHPHEATRHERDAAVEQHHGHHGAGPNAVQSREIGQTSVRNRALVVLHLPRPSWSTPPPAPPHGWPGNRHCRRPGPPPPGTGLATLVPPEPDPSPGPSGVQLGRPSGGPRRPCPAARCAAGAALPLLVALVAAAVAARPHPRAGSHPAARPHRRHRPRARSATRPTPRTYCNKFSAYWDAGIDDCGNDNLDEEWCADFAAWVWKQAGAEVEYQLAPGYLNGNSASFYVWGTDHGTWHPVGSGYTPQPGDVAVYGLDTGAGTAVHVAVVTATTGNDRART